LSVYVLSTLFVCGVSLFCIMSTLLFFIYELPLYTTSFFPHETDSHSTDNSLICRLSILHI